MKLKVLSFNIRCCDDKNGNAISERAPRLFKVVSPYDADIIALQEYRPKWEEHIHNYFSDKYDIFVKYRNETVDIEAVPILWKKDKFTLIKSGYFWLSDTPEIESRGWDELYNCYRICAYVILKDNETSKEFTVMNTHFGFGDKGQTDSANLIYDYSKKISDNATFVVGDFNMTPENVAYNEMVKYFSDANISNDLTTTYHGYTPETITNKHIDYCFVDENTTPINQIIIKETVDGFFPSDHYGLFIELDL